MGHRSLMDVARLSGPPEAWHLGFLLGPRINAGGRIGRADLGCLKKTRTRRRKSPLNSTGSTANDK
jgi:single-stranded DNA-specific DHH superfamily exonuclease